MLPQLLGVDVPKDLEVCDLYKMFCILLRTFYLHKWCTHRIFNFMDDSGDHILQHHEFEQVICSVPIHCQTVMP